VAAALGGPAGPQALRVAGLHAGRKAGWRRPAALAGWAAGWLARGSGLLAAGCGLMGQKDRVGGIGFRN
jgi:hypothetical protein